MITLTATLPCGAPPAWAVWERHLFSLLDAAVTPYWEKYLRPDGRLIWRATMEASWQPRDGVDDFYEAVYNWPLLYLLGGGDHLLTRSHTAWEGITAQLTEMGMLKNEFDIGYDQFHISEGQLFFDFLCLADPANQSLIARARRFAGLYLNEDPAALNDDPQYHLIRAPHTGSGGPRWGYLADEPPTFPWAAGMRRYGLPYSDVPGVTSYDDLRDPAHAAAMGAAVQARMGRGDVATNLLATTIVANAALMTGEAKYTAWIAAYVAAWQQRAQANGGLLPDNVGLSGEVGEYIAGKWYGGLYGWTWPHGFYNIGAAAFVAAANAFVLTRDARFLALPRDQLHALMAHGELRDGDTSDMTLRHHWASIFAALEPPRTTWLIPYRYGDGGWFDYQPVPPGYPVSLWALSMAPTDGQTITDLRRLSQYDWRHIFAMRTKEDSGHEAPWFTFLAGENPDYPVTILAQACEVAAWKLALVHADDADLTEVSIHHWQQHNPVTTEALVQLTLGAPQHNYYGGLLHCRLRYFDAERRRPGLPPDVAALVTRLAPTQTTVQLVNLGLAPRTLIVQAGGLAEHQFRHVRYSQMGSDYPGPFEEVTNVPAVATVWHEATCDGPHLRIELPPTSQVTLELTMELHSNAPTYAAPWSTAREA